MRLAHVMSTTRIVSSKSDLLHLHDGRTQHKKCRRILKQVLKPYDIRSHNQNVRMTSCLRSFTLTLTRADRATNKSRIQRSYKSAFWAGISYEVKLNRGFIFFKTCVSGVGKGCFPQE